VKKILCWLLGHEKGYTREGLPILPVGRVDRFYRNTPFRSIVIQDDVNYPEPMRDTYGQEIFRCGRCGSQLVEHL
jgi:hypothetical protein